MDVLAVLWRLLSRRAFEALPQSLTDTHLKRLMDVVQSQNVALMTASVIRQSLQDLPDWSKKLLTLIRPAVHAARVRRDNNLKLLTDVVEYVNGCYEDIKIIPLKGLFTRKLYPNPAWRQLSDIDLGVVTWDHAWAMIKILQRMGLYIDEPLCLQFDGNQYFGAIRFASSTHPGASLELSISQFPVGNGLGVPLKALDESTLTPAQLQFHIQVLCGEVMSHGALTIKDLLDYEYLTSACAGNLPKVRNDLARPRCLLEWVHAGLTRHHGCPLGLSVIKPLIMRRGPSFVSSMIGSVMQAQGWRTFWTSLRYREAVRLLQRKDMPRLLESFLLLRADLDKGLFNIDLLPHHLRKSRLYLFPRELVNRRLNVPMPHCAVRIPETGIAVDLTNWVAATPLGTWLCHPNATVRESFWG